VQTKWRFSAAIMDARVQWPATAIVAIRSVMLWYGTCITAAASSSAALCLQMRFELAGGTPISVDGWLSPVV
jgi:hypothetical protein